MTTIKTKEETKKILEKIGFSFSSKEDKKETDTDKKIDRLTPITASV